MGERLSHKDTRCIVGVKSASGYFGSRGKSCHWDISIETEYSEMRFDCDEHDADCIVFIMSGDGSMVLWQYSLEEVKSVFLVGPAEYRVIIFAKNGYGSWSVEWD